MQKRQLVTNRNWARRHPAQYKAIKRRWAVKNPDRIVAIRRRSILRRRGTTEDWYGAQEKRQKGRCGICKTSDKGDRRWWCIDHSPETGEPRGLLCFQCNVGLGNFKDSVELLQAAEKYLADGSVGN